jgi:hypothetical protein
LIQIRDDFERSSISVALSFVSGSGDGAIITLTPRLQKSNDVFEDWVPAAAPAPAPAPIPPTVPVSIDLNLGSATFAGTATINADGSWDATLKARGTWR